MGKSLAIVYPVNIYPYSIESETEQMMQIFEASEIRDFIIRKYDLYKHWDIDENGSQARFFMLKTYSENVSINRTNYESAIVSVMDFDPDTAKLIADDVLNQFNLKARELSQSKSIEYLDMANKTLGYLKNKIDSLAFRLDSLRFANNILDYELQTQEVTQGYYRMLASGNGGNKIEEAKSIAIQLVEKSKAPQDYLLVSEIYVKEKKFDTALKYLESAGFELETLVPVDMFPQTYHIENVVHIKKC